jgi:hypothetical protein
MKNALKTDSTFADPDSPPDDASPSLRDLASYLKGVADAAAALSQPPGSASARQPPTRPEAALCAGNAPSSRRTIPYDGHEGPADTIPVRSGSVHPEPAAGMGSYIDDAPEEPFLDERASDVRLRIGQLSPAWQHLLNARPG